MSLSHQDIFIFGYKVPHYFWFLISGLLCDIIQIMIDYTISIIYPFEMERTTVCWTLSYILSIAVRHTSHKYIVFGEYEGTYWQSLGRTYLAYSSSIVISMISNHMLSSYVGFSHKLAYASTLIWIGIYNYFILKASWKANNNNTSNILSKNNELSDLVNNRTLEELESLVESRDSKAER